jgi:sugar/nucleoside kinase (ribokinase family)
MLFHVVGESYVDLLCYLEASLPKQAEDSVLSQPVQTTAGGSTLNTATHLSELQRHLIIDHQPSSRQVVAQTVLNPNDEYGMLLQRHADKHDIQVINCFKVDPNDPAMGKATPHCVVVVAEGDRTFMTHRGCAAKFTGLDLQLKDLVEYDGPVALHVAGLYCTPGFGDGSLRDQTVRLRKERAQRWPHHQTIVSLVTQFDVQKQWEGGLDDLVPHLQFVIMNELEANSIVHRAKGYPSSVDATANYSLHDFIFFFSSLSSETVFVVTRGAEGAIAFRDKCVIANVNPGVTLEVVDPTGAGDAFAAGFLNELREWDQCSKSVGNSHPRQDGDEVIVRGLSWGCALGTAVVTIRGASVPAPMEFVMELKCKQKVTLLGA